MDIPPKPNTQSINWFVGEFKKGALDLTPEYQRKLIWSRGQQCFLIDSIISGCPIPQVYLNVISKGIGNKRESIYEVIDGQQRLTTIIQFVNDEWSLTKSTCNYYPVSKDYSACVGKKYSELGGDYQDAIWNYPLAVQEIRNWSREKIKALFQRLNYVVEKLSRQELRHSQYIGLFVKSVEELAKDEFWERTRLFSRRDIQRMRDVEFASELFLIAIDGVQDQQKTLDEYYSGFDIEFPQRSKFMSLFRKSLSSLKTIEDVILDTRFRKKADFYGLFSAVVKLNEYKKVPVDLSSAGQALRKFSLILESPADELTGSHFKYYKTIIEGPDKLPKRKLRQEILLNLLDETL